MDWLKIPFEERLKHATHYIRTHEPSATVTVGYEEGGYFFRLYISLHKAEAKRLKLKEYKAPETSSRSR